MQSGRPFTPLKVTPALITVESSLGLLSIEGAVCIYEALSAFRLVSLSNVELELLGMSLRMGIRSKILQSQTSPLNLSEDAVYWLLFIRLHLGD